MPGPSSGRRPDVAVLVGYPGAGKSTFYREHLRRTHLQLSRDLMKAPSSEGLRARLDEALAAGRSVAIDNTNPRRQDRAPYVAAARRHGATVSCFLLVATLRECIARNARRTGSERVPVVAILTAARRLEVPDGGEGFDRLFEVRPLQGSEFDLRELPAKK